MKLLRALSVPIALVIGIGVGKLALMAGIEPLGVAWFIGFLAAIGAVFGLAFGTTSR